MAAAKAQQKVVHKYVKANYDRAENTIPKGQKQALEAHAKSKSESERSCKFAYMRRYELI